MSLHTLNTSHIGHVITHRLSGYLAALALVGLTTMLTAVMKQIAPISHVSMFFVLPVLGTALRWGLGPSLFCAMLSIFTCSIFYFPAFSFQINAPTDLADLAAFAVVALIAGPAADSLRTKVATLGRQEREFRHLYDLGREVVAADTLADIRSALTRHLAAILDRPVVLQMIGDEPLLGAKPEDDAAITKALGREIAIDGLRRSRAVALPDGRYFLCRSLHTRERSLAVLMIALPDVGDLDDERTEQALSILEDGATSLERFGIAAALEDGRIRAKADELRDLLIGTVSHDLRTPLAGIMGATTVLQGAEAIAGDPRLAGLSTLIQEEAERLDQTIQTLLDATRIRSGTLAPRLDWAEAPDLLQSALQRCRHRLAGHEVAITVEPDLPLLRLDMVLIAQALINLLDNAAKYAPAGTKVTLSAAQESQEIILAVTDQGPGLSGDEAVRLFNAFYRGDRSGVPGTGLGLAVARVFVEANEGTIAAQSAGPGAGTRMEMRFPIAAPPPDLEEMER